VILIDDDEVKLVGYGTWGHVTATTAGKAEKHIEIGWFGIDSAYQDKKASGKSIAGALYRTVEGAARADAGSTPDMPITLVCHMDNENGLGFWQSRGFRFVNEAELEDEVYHRMVR
jgi:ribosomal protein S18 acetylase RimI-like enzyme